jgi:RNA polymerase sigma-70 factor, ECF subfamily
MDMTDETRPDFETLYREYFRFVYRAMRRSMGSFGDGEIEDLVQEVFLIAHRKLHQFDGSCSPGTWLYGICWRVASQSRRRRKIERLFGLRRREEATVFPPENADQTLSKAQLKRHFHQLLDQLGSRKRQVLILYEVEGYSGAEIARLLGCKEATVWSRLHHARKDFQRLLDRSELSRAAGLASLAGTI